MPQMDFTTFFPQVYWLLVCFLLVFIYLLRGSLSNAIMLFKLKFAYIFIGLNYLKNKFFILINEFFYFFNSAFLKVKVFCIKNNFFNNVFLFLKDLWFNWKTICSAQLSKIFNFIFDKTKFLVNINITLAN